MGKKEEWNKIHSSFFLFCDCAFTGAMRMFALLDSYCDVERQRLGTTVHPSYMIYW